MLTIRTVSDEITPSPVGLFRQANLNLHFTNGKFARVRIYLAFEWLQEEDLVAIYV
jgi:hypothetical protein